jgi:hypothetical protein
MTRRATKEVTIDREAWARNLRAPRDARDKGATMRRLNNYLAFRAICPSRACGRAKRCAGDAQACFDYIFPQLPERMKVQFRVTLKAAHAGGSPEDVKRKIREELARFDALEALKERTSNESPRPAQRGEGKKAPERARTGACPNPRPSRRSRKPH